MHITDDVTSTRSCAHFVHVPHIHHVCMAEKQKAERNFLHVRYIFFYIVFTGYLWFLKNKSHTSAHVVSMNVTHFVNEAQDTVLCPLRPPGAKSGQVCIKQPNYRSLRLNVSSVNTSIGLRHMGHNPVLL